MQSNDLQDPKLYKIQKSKDLHDPKVQRSTICEIQGSMRSKRLKCNSKKNNLYQSLTSLFKYSTTLKTSKKKTNKKKTTSNVPTDIIL